MEERLADCKKIQLRTGEVKIGKNVRAAPKVSVIIPAYNISTFVAETLNSVFAQTYKDFEVVLVNDGSKDTDELETALEPFWERIVYARQVNLGAAQARNLAICLARGELLAFLDGDDVWRPDFLGSQMDFLEKNQLEMVYCDAELFGEPFFAGKTFMQSAPSSGAVTTVSLISTDCNVITSGTLLKKDLLQKTNLFDTDLPQMQDFDLWFRLARIGTKIGYQTKVLLKYRVRSNSLSGTNVERAARNIRAMSVIESKYALDAREKEAWRKQMAQSQAELELEQSKLSLVEGKFAEAEAHLAVANRFYRKRKLSLVKFLLRLSPKLTLRLFKKLRPDEFSFISPNKI